MKKIILSLSVFCFFATVFGFACNERRQTISADELTRGLCYDCNSQRDGFFDYYNITAGANGKVFTNQDIMDTNWVERNSNTTNNLNDIQNYPDPTKLMTCAVGNNGTIIRSYDKGHTWTLLNSGVTEDLLSVDFVNGGFDTTIIACGRSGRIIKSTNGGNNWFTVNSGVTQNLNSIYSGGAFQNIIAGDNGKILHSTNSGNNWIVLTLPDSVTNLNKVGSMGTWFLGNIYGIVGDNGKLYRSSSFFSWNPVETGISEDLFDIAFRNASSGFVCGENGKIIYTIDGGVNWFTDFFLEMLTTDDITSAIIIDDTTAAGVTGNEFILIHANEQLLPVELLSFTASVNANDVKLFWITGSETNNSGFAIEKKNDNTDWINTGFIKGKGTTSGPSAYTFTDKNLTPGKYRYRIKQIDYNGNYEFFYLENEIVIGVPEQFTLYQNFPNPFNPVTKITFELPHQAIVQLKVYDISGKEIDVLINENLIAGFHEKVWNASAFSSGVYFYRLETENFVETRKMILTK